MNYSSTSIIPISYGDTNGWSDSSGGSTASDRAGWVDSGGYWWIYPPPPQAPLDSGTPPWLKIVAPAEPTITPAHDEREPFPLDRERRVRRLR